MAPSLLLPFVPFTLYMNLVLEQNRWHEERKTSRIFLSPRPPSQGTMVTVAGNRKAVYLIHTTLTVFTRIDHKR